MRAELQRFLATMVREGPSVTPDAAERLVREHYGIVARAERLTGERDENFKLSAGGGAQYMFKVAHEAEESLVSDLQTAALLHIERADPTFPCPRVCRARDGGSHILFDDEMGRPRTASLVTFLPGRRLASSSRSPAQRAACGRMAAQLARALRHFVHPASHRMVLWDLRHFGDLRVLLPALPGFPELSFVRDVISEFEAEVAPQLASVRHQFVHNDLNVTNVLVDSEDEARVTGVLDFGDALHTALVADVAIALVGQITNLSAAGQCIEEFVAAYQAVEPLHPPELRILNRLAAARIVQGVLIPSWHRARNPEAGHFEAMDSAHIGRRIELARYLTTRGRLEDSHVPSHETTLLARRRRVLAPTYGLFYDEPVLVVRAEGVWMFGADGRRYLDAYNNVPVVGHGHPYVVERLCHQARMLNTHTRYLTDAPPDLAERLTATLPPELKHVTFMCTGSEANDLAVRISKAATGGTGFIVTNFAYHGTTEATAALSPASGVAPGPNVFTVEPPGAGDTGSAFGSRVRACIESMRAGEVRPAALLVDTIFSSDGIVSDPAGFLTEAVEAIHEAGGLFIADEVQAGFGRTGAAMWGFQRHGVVPDIVTMGKPMGNGHPIAALVARAQVLEEFARRTRYFNTFGGNTVSCEVALAVLEVIEREGLRKNAQEVGAHLQKGLRELSERHSALTDVRGAGLFIGVQTASAATARRLANEMRRLGVLIGTTGRPGDTLKIRPPLILARAEADLLLDTLSTVLRAENRRSA